MLKRKLEMAEDNAKDISQLVTERDETIGRLDDHYFAL